MLKTGAGNGPDTNTRARPTKMRVRGRIYASKLNGGNKNFNKEFPAIQKGNLIPEDIEKMIKIAEDSQNRLRANKVTTVTRTMRPYKKAKEMGREDYKLVKASHWTK